MFLPNWLPDYTRLHITKHLCYHQDRGKQNIRKGICRKKRKTIEKRENLTFWWWCVSTKAALDTSA